MQALKQQVELSNNPFAIAEIERLVTQVQVTRLQALIAQIDSHLIELAGGQQMTIEEFLSDTYESVYYKSGYSLAVGTGIGTSFTKINERAVKEAIAYPWSGDMFSQRIWTNRGHLVRNMRQTIINGFIQGSSVQKISRELARKMNNSYKNSLRLIRTETAYVMEQASFDARKEYDVEEYQFIATLDNRTGAKCRGLDGQIFKVKDRQVGVNAAPVHPNCRSTTVPYFGRSYINRRARGSDNQSEVIPYIKYEDWHSRYVK